MRRENGGRGTTFITGGSSNLADRIWLIGTTYNPGDVVGYAGRMWMCLIGNVGKPPTMFTTLWQPVTGADAYLWSHLDPTFSTDDIQKSWQFFWATAGTGGALPTWVMSSAAADIEGGRQSWKLTLPAGAGQSVFEHEENFVNGGDYIGTSIRMKVISGSVTVDGNLMQNDATAGPDVFAPGLVQTGAQEGSQVVPAGGWITINTSFKAANGKPRARVRNVFTNAGATTAVVVVQSIKTQRSPYPTDTEWVVVPSAGFLNGWQNYGGIYDGAAYRRKNGQVELRGLVRLGTVAQPIFMLNGWFAPKSPKIKSAIVNTQTSGPASASTAHTHILNDVAIRINIGTDGSVVVNHALAGNGYLSLEDIKFHIDS